MLTSPEVALICRGQTEGLMSNRAARGSERTRLSPATLTGTIAITQKTRETINKKKERWSSGGVHVTGRQEAVTKPQPDEVTGNKT